VREAKALGSEKSKGLGCRHLYEQSREAEQGRYCNNQTPTFPLKIEEEIERRETGGM
jgi:hypothetical protein